MNATSLGILGVALLSALSLGAGEPAPDAGEAASCVAWRGEARYRGYGYDHVVVLNNHCDGVAWCEVSSDVMPVPVEVVIEPGEDAEVLLWRGSPVREFIPAVVCQIALRQE